MSVPENPENKSAGSKKEKFIKQGKTYLIIAAVCLVLSIILYFVTENIISVILGGLYGAVNLGLIITLLGGIYYMVRGYTLKE